MSADASGVRGAPDRGAWRPLATIAWAGAVMAVFVAVQVVVVVALEGTENPAPDGGTIALATLAATLPATALLLAAASRRSPWREYLAVDRPSGADVRGWVVAFVLLLAAVDLATWSLGLPVVPDQVLQMVGTARPLWLLAAVVLVTAPVFEELLFRGFIYRGLASTRLGPFGAIGLAAGLWAALHVQYGPYHVALVVVYGLVLGVARWRSGSTTLAILLHATANLVAFVQAWVVLD